MLPVSRVHAAIRAPRSSSVGSTCTSIPSPAHQGGQRLIADDAAFMASTAERNGGGDQWRKVAARASGGDHQEAPHRRITSSVDSKVRVPWFEECSRCPAIVHMSR